MEFQTTDSNQQPLSWLIDNPPPTFKEGVSGWRNRHDEVLNYARAVFGMLAADPVLSNWHRTCPVYSSFYRAGENITPTKQDLAQRSVNLCKLTVDMKVSRLYADRLTLHYTSAKNSDYQVAQAVQRWFDYHERATGRRALQRLIEKAAPIYGMCAASVLPQYDYARDIAMPAVGKYLAPENIFFDTKYNTIEEMPYFAIREVACGRIEDQKYKDLLKKRDVERFGRGSQINNMWGYMLPKYTYGLFNKIEREEVEVIRIWIKDYTTDKQKIYFVDTPEAVEAHMQAEMELQAILEEGHLPSEGENHYNHYLAHLEHKKALESDPNVTPLMLEFLDLHMKATEELLRTQPPDDKIEMLRYKGGWRYIKIIGDQVVHDGSSELEFGGIPVALFRNNINTETIIGISDMDSIMNINRDLNALLSDMTESSYKHAFPQPYYPERLRDTEVNKDGEPAWLVEPIEAQMIGYVTPPPYPAQAKEAISLFTQYVQMIGGANSTVLGDVPRTRTSGVGIEQLQAASSIRYVATQDLLSEGWERFAKIALSQFVQFTDQPVTLGVIGPEYQEAIEIIPQMVDTDAHLRVERVPRDLDFQRQRGQELLQLAQIAVSVFGVPPPGALEVLSQQADAGTVSQIFGEFQQWLAQNQAAQAMMQAQYQNQVMQSAGMGAPQGQGGAG